MNKKKDAASSASEQLAGRPAKKRPGRVILERPSGPGTALANFLIDYQDAHPDVSNTEIAEKLGYASQNMISMWRTGKTKISLDNLPRLAELFGVDLGYLVALFVEQYAVANRRLTEDCALEVYKASKRVVTEREMEIIDTIRRARKGNDLKLRHADRQKLEDMFALPDTAEPGPLKPSSEI